jgi:hypothetical protein
MEEEEFAFVSGSERDAPATACGETPQPQSRSAARLSSYAEGETKAIDVVLVARFRLSRHQISF